jgi:hypothetical protein
VVRREPVSLERLAAALDELHARLRIARMSDEEDVQLKVVGIVVQNPK